MACFIQSYGDVRLALRDRPAFNDFILFPVNDINLVLGFVIDEYFRARFFQSHGFKRVSVDLDIGHLLSGFGFKNEDRFVTLWSRKKPPPLEIDFKMIEMPLDSSR